MSTALKIRAEDRPAPAFAPAAAPDPAKRSVLRFITCGSVDDGKSTLIGRILYECGAVFDDHLDALDRDSAKYGTNGRGRDYALLVDGLAAEREQGITIDVAYRYFATPKRSFIVADTPGHEQYTRNMATGASTADLAILLVDARKGLLPQTRRHAFIVSMVGVKHVVVAVNKMDLVGYDAGVFRAIEADFKAAAADLGFASITFIPVSAREGDNLTTHSQNMPWYRGTPLLPLLEGVEIGPRDAAKSGFAMPVQWVNRPDADFRGFSGTIATGAIAVGAEVVALPSGQTSRIARIVTANGDLDAAHQGQAVTLVLTDEIDLSRGDVLASKGGAGLSVTSEITARLILTGERAVTVGAEFLLKLGTTLAKATITGLRHAIDIESYAEITTDRLRLNAIGVVTLRLDRKIALTSFAENADLGGFILIDRLTNETSAFGFVEGAAVAKPAKPKLTLVSPDGTAPTGSALAQRRLPLITWRIVSALATAGVVFAISGDARFAVGAAIADLTLRPLARLGHDALWRRLSSGLTFERSGA